MHEAERDRWGPDVRRNFVLNVVDGSLFAGAMSLVSRTTVLPVFVYLAGGGNLAVGLIPVLWLVGLNLPQIFIANHTRQEPSKKRLVVRTAFLQRLPWLLLAVLAGWGIEALSAPVGLALFFVGFGLAAVLGSLNLPPWFDLVAKVTPVRLRGRLFGVRTLVGGVLGIGGGYVAERVLEAMSFPDSFTLLFGLAFAITMVSYVFLAMVREGEPVPPKPRIRYRAFLRSLPEILRRERNYRHFLIAEALALAALMGEAFFMVDAIERFELSEGYAGRFTMVIMLSMIVGPLLFGAVADRYGHRLNMMLSAACSAMACLAALLAPSVEVYALAFVGSAFALGLRQVSHLSFIAEICREDDRPTYVALSSLLTSPFVLSGVLAGWVANVGGYDLVFGIAGLLAAAAAAWLAVMVHEPRSARAQ